MKQAKKGFTLIEIAIVLVVIGLILGMVMKGRSLIDAAQLRSEVNKINKLQAAYTTYFSKFNRRPGTKTAEDSTTTVSSEQIYIDLIAEGLLTDADFTIPTLGVNWAFSGCVTDGNDSAGIPKGWLTKTLGESSNVCIYPDATALGKAPSGTAKASLQFICNIENLLDDKNDVTGSGRMVGGTAITKAELNACDKLSEEANKDYRFRIY